MSPLPRKYLERLTPLKYHKIQQQIIADTYRKRYRFTICPSGRRSGKTEIVGKRRFVARAVVGVKAPNPRYFVAAPTRDQVKRMYWNDLKTLTLPFRNPGKTPSESNLIIYLKDDREIHLLGMDKPERVEGSHWDGGVLDEVANMKKKTWPEHVRPALSTPGRPKAWCDFVGVPEGRNFFYKLYRKAKAEFAEHGINSAWNVYHWKSADILSADEIEDARKDLDELTYQQEYEGSFINFTGRTYYNFQETTHCAKLAYDPRANIGFCFDFNVDPGVCAVVQEQNYVCPKTHVPIIGEQVTGVIGEVYIPRNSNTPAVCKKLIKDWGKHEGNVLIYGDATGGSRGSAKVQGSDWDLVKATLRPHFNKMYFKVKSSNPRERARVNAMNSRLKSVNGDIRLQVDPMKAPNVVLDLEGVQNLEGGSGEIDKKVNLELTHISDGLGYYVEKEYPVKGKKPTVRRIGGF